MDPKLSIPWKTRLFQLRIAIHYLPPNFARLLGVNKVTYRRLEKGELEPNIQAIRRIRLLERAFAEELETYHKQVKRWHAKWTWGKEQKVYEKYGGYAHKKVPIGYRSSNVIPRRTADIEALGGIQVFRYAQGKTVGHPKTQPRYPELDRAIPDSPPSPNKSRFTQRCEVE